VSDIPGVRELTRDLSALVNFAQDCHSGKEYKLVPLSDEEIGVVASYRDFVDRQKGISS